MNYGQATTCKAASGKQVTKCCHWVPQTYLRDFAANQGRTKIWRFSKESGDPELKPIQKVAVRYYLYVPRDATAQTRDDSFEQKLSELERWFGDPVWRAIQTEPLDLAWKELRMLISLMVAVMYLRTPIHFEHVKAFHRRMVTEIETLDHIPKNVRWRDQEHEIDPDSWPSYRDASEDDLKRLWITQMNDATEYAKILVGMRWSICFADRPTFVTSDNPVTIVHPSLTFRGCETRKRPYCFRSIPSGYS